MVALEAPSSGPRKTAKFRKAGVCLAARCLTDEKATFCDVHHIACATAALVSWAFIDQVLEVVMKIGTKELIVRLTAAAIGFALTGAVFLIAVAQPQEATAIVTQATEARSYETQAQMRERGWVARLSPNIFFTPD
jgi:hypothetical protein